MKLSVVFWNNHSDLCIEQALTEDIARSVMVYEAKSFTQVLELLEKHPSIEMLLTTLHPTDLQTLCNFQQLQQRYPDVALVAIVDSMLRIPNVMNILRRLVERAEQTSNAETTPQYATGASELTDIIDCDSSINSENSFLNESPYIASDSYSPMQDSDYKPSSPQMSQPLGMENIAEPVGHSSPYLVNPDGNIDPRCHLTPRQVDVLYLLMRGKSNKEIARILDLSEGTVKIHCMAIFRELGVNNRTQAAIRAEQLLPKLQSHWGGNRPPLSNANYGV